MYRNDNINIIENVIFVTKIYVSCNMYMESTNASLKPILHDIRNMQYLTKDQLDQISTSSETDKMRIIEIFNDVLNWVVDNEKYE
jgi:tRNA uridine 5-carbamoylmethylation protein Kti12